MALILAAAAATAGSVLGQQFEAFHIPPPDTASPFGFFGQRVAVDPPWAAVADRAESDVFLYELTPMGWRLTQSILEGPSDLFGDSMAIDGDTLVVGSPYWDWSVERKGKVFVYGRDGTEWRRAQELQPPGLRWGDLFGDAVAIDGNVLVAGAPNVGSPAFNNGAVFIYEWGGGTWNLEGLFRYDFHTTAVQPQANLGRAVAVSGRTVVAGAEAAGAFEGEAWVFERVATGWRHTAVLADPTPTTGDQFGNAVSISGDTILVGEKAGQGIGGLQTKKGSAFIFERAAGGSWNLVQEVTPSDGWSDSSTSDLFGTDVAIEANRAVIVAPNSNASGPGNGAIYHFLREETGAWPQHETEVYFPSDPLVNFGGSDVDQRDGVVLAGSISPRSAYVFEIESGTPFCMPAPNSSGRPGHLAAVFSPEGGGVLSVHDAPPTTLGAFLASPSRDQIIFQPSSLCLGAGMWRLDLVAPTGGSGAAMHQLDLSSSGGLVSGVTFYFQYWFQDPIAAVSTFNFTNAVAAILP